MVGVLVNGYGSIGKRVADAVAKQDDMKVIGVTKTKPDFEARMAVTKGYKLFAAIPEKKHLFEEANIPIEGTIEDIIEDADIVVDGAPKKIGKANVENVYKKHNVKAIIQGGEKAKDAEDSFNSLWSYNRCYGKDYIRLVSCNTTGLCRTLYAIDSITDILKARVVLVRRAADPNDIKTGPINAIIPDPVTVPSHHGPDVVSVIPKLDGKIMTSAIIVPTTLMHMHSLMVETTGVTKDAVLDAIEKTPRIIKVKASEGIDSTAKIIEYSRDLGRLRYDLNEIAIWEESINVVDNEIYLMQAIHQESDVIPENIDCIRAMLEMEEDNIKSIEKTNRALGLLK
ncbi:glyceraldehyde-3-phosphate dehydrogenase, type II [Methanococcus vannielii SB]|jgi:glyceraldehyde-3-phosphate dehydrogenase (NAD(P))|uniref:Glyceraldehyde-3-phosphate dehydrogenase n=1 Tax=Methanococcus vannielii (strain ATCC 35089 / DSM 1224 / JCM 13029 / OCM 148 / SB) TaxID=406327 RepID=G3P_METVS|nr:type II glyceraldehyde-3-phosphate dehydrogenase [Methanococcus vannielii]A6URW1.1 RecName: Full=Glyceraldehyde-3-phosphate dehydrogenase; Short=GAPDH; AltName: Full=NAD(P)-dependent glyceraldehyde-3-phosphate dehydrogenase [Methanococcus vannielii SB]ABR55233.1 glyceraldehyde-3-phosphate dehydrogenase, type II [Methanococcus vannielii SB]